MFRNILLISATVLLAGCGIANDSRYGGGNCPFRYLTFYDGGKVDIMGKNGLVKGTYSLKGDAVTVSALDGKVVFKRDNDRLVWGTGWTTLECKLMARPGSGSASPLKGGGGVPGLVLFIVGWGPLFWVGKRRFDRTNVAGVEEFASFGKAVVSRLLEKVAALVGIVMVLVGLGLMVVNWS